MAKKEFEGAKPHLNFDMLCSMPSGCAQFTMQFDRYDPMPQNISNEIQSEYA